MTPVALFLFEHSTHSAQPWADAGHLCLCVDVQHPAGVTRHGNIWLVGMDLFRPDALPYLLSLLPPDADVAFACAFPPCTHLAVSGARWFVGKGLRLLSESIMLFAVAAEICEALGCPYFLENPVSTIGTYWRKPDYAFDPCDYAGWLEPADRINEAYTKRTCLWAGGGFLMPVKKPVLALLGSKMHRLPPSADRANLRSETPRGFARAVFEANIPAVFA